MSMCANRRRFVAFVAGIVLLVGVAATAAGQTALTGPVTLDVSTLRSVVLVLSNGTPFEIAGFTVSLLDTENSSVMISRIEVRRYSSGAIGDLSSGFVVDDNDDGSRSPTESDEFVYPAAKIAHTVAMNSSLSPGTMFVTLVQFTERLPDGASLFIAPEKHGPWGFSSIFSSGGQ